MFQRVHKLLVFRKNSTLRLAIIVQSSAMDGQNVCMKVTYTVRFRYGSVSSSHANKSLLKFPSNFQFGGIQSELFGSVFSENSTIYLFLHNSILTRSMVLGRLYFEKNCKEIRKGQSARITSAPRKPEGNIFPKRPHVFKPEARCAIPNLCLKKQPPSSDGLPLGAYQQMSPIEITRRQL